MENLTFQQFRDYLTLIINQNKVCIIYLIDNKHLKLIIKHKDIFNHLFTLEKVFNFENLKFCDILQLNYIFKNDYPNLWTGKNLKAK